MITSLLIAVAAAASPTHCPPVELSITGSARTFVSQFARNSGGFRKTSANFAKAYARACSEGLIKGRPLPPTLHLFNAPDANVPSIYRSGKVIFLEYPFVSGGKVNVPSVDDLHEAIFCAVQGPSAKEQEETGRCLAD
ncbi:MAG TPA: hypothetical protein VF067_08375 [Sphingomicrobium sp.]